MMRNLRTVALLAALTGALPTAAMHAQDNVPWRLSYFPYLNASPNDGVMGIARAIWFQQAGWGERVTLDKFVAVEAGYSTRDAWKASATFGAPRLTDDWRVMAHAAVSHQPHFGNSDRSFPTDRDEAVGWVDLTRRVVGPLHVAVRPAIRRQTLDYRQDDAMIRLSETDLSIRGALVLDLRDREFEVNRGVLLEAGTIAGSGGGDRGYSAPYAHLRGYTHPILPLRLTGRFGWRGATATGALAPVYEFPGWEGDFTILGGRLSDRGVPIAALSADGAAFAGLEARFDVINIGEIGAVTLLAFVDGGKPLYAKNTERLVVGDNWTWAAGGGIALRVLRAATLTVTAARANGDTRWYVGSGWSW